MSSMYLRSDPLLQILCFEVQTLYLTVIQAPCMFVPLYITGLQTEVKKIQLRQVLEFSILSLTADSEVGREEACQGYSCVSNRCILPVWGLSKPLDLHIYSRSFSIPFLSHFWIWFPQHSATQLHIWNTANCFPVFSGEVCPLQACWMHFAFCLWIIPTEILPLGPVPWNLLFL